jgi:hypothetical protein
VRLRLLSTSVALALVGGAAVLLSPGLPALAGGAAVFEGPVPRASCGPGSSPETGLQGQVPLRDRQSGRSQRGYSCNMGLVGQYQGQGTTWVSQSYEHCAYHAQAFPSSLTGAHPGVQVVDVRDPAAPKLADTLTSPAFLGNTWESLKVNEPRGLLAGVFVGPAVGAASFDVYDVGTDCLHPKLLNSVAGSSLSIPADTLGHEGSWSPDGRTYWSSGLAGGLITAIDVSDPTKPRIVFTGSTGQSNHGLSFSPDGRRMYIAEADLGGAVPTQPALSKNGLKIFDVSAVQDRALLPQIRLLGTTYWSDGAAGQHAVPVTYGGKPHVFFVDELKQGSARLVDVSDPTAPRVVSKLKLEIHLPSHAAERAKDLGAAENGTVFGYDGHYCAVDRPTDPTALACGFFNSGVRVFDVRKPTAPKEIGYFNPPAQVAKKAELTGSEHAQGVVNGGPAAVADLTADWCSSPPRFVGSQVWVTCQDNGFMVLRLTNGAYPLRGAS